MLPQEWRVLTYVLNSWKPSTTRRLDWSNSNICFKLINAIIEEIEFCALSFLVLLVKELHR